MTRSRLGLRAISLCLALAGLMAVGAGSAQATPNSFWLVNGIKLTTLLPELAGDFDGGDGTLLGSIGGVGIHILCKNFTFAAGGHLLAQGGVLGSVTFSGCTILRLKEGKAEALGACTPPGGLITTKAAKGLILLHELINKEKHPITHLEPLVGTLFTTINTGPECAFGESISINGKLAVKDCKNAFLVDQVTHLIEEFAPLTELYINGNKANKATIDGTANIFLAGIPHKGMTWAGHPE